MPSYITVELAMFAKFLTILFQILIVTVGLLIIYLTNMGKKLTVILFMLTSTVQNFLVFGKDDHLRFIGLVIPITIGTFLLFYVFEKVAKDINESCRYQKDKIRIKSTLEDELSTFPTSHHGRLSKNFEEIKAWVFMDNIEYRNITSVKTKVLLRTSHYWIMITTLILVVVFLFNVTVDFEKLLILIPLFFVMYQFLANQHWNQWKYCADLFNNLPAPDNPLYKNKKLCLMMDLIILDLWANKSFMEFFAHNLQEQTQLRELGEKELLDLLAKAQCKQLDSFQSLGDKAITTGRSKH